jgi:hypothetical protein
MTAYIDRHGGQYHAFYYNEGNVIRLGSGSDLSALKGRIKRKKFDKIVCIFPTDRSWIDNLKVEKNK